VALTAVMAPRQVFAIAGLLGLAVRLGCARSLLRAAARNEPSTIAG
jgi:hypothetical protein